MSAIAFVTLSACDATPPRTTVPTATTAPAWAPSATAQHSAAIASPVPSPRQAAGGADAAPEFAIDILRQPRGASEPSLVVSESGVIVIAAGSWLRNEAAGFSTSYWRALPGLNIVSIGSIDRLDTAGEVALSGRDVDLAIDADGALRVTSTMRFFEDPQTPDPSHSENIVAVFRCQNIEARQFTTDECTGQLLARENADRPWIALDGTDAFVVYEDADRLLRAVRSMDAGATWGAGGTFLTGGPPRTQPLDNLGGPLLFDPARQRLSFGYSTDLSGRGGQHDFLVALSDDRGATWSTVPVWIHETGSSAFFPTLARDSTDGRLYMTWSDSQQVFVAVSANGGDSWEAPAILSGTPVGTAVQPTVVAQNGQVDVAWYGAAGQSPSEPSNDWSLYLARSVDGGQAYSRSVVAPRVHVGEICLLGDACAVQLRTMLELFEMAYDPTTGRLVIAYVDDVLDRDESGLPLPQVVLAVEE